MRRASRLTLVALLVGGWLALPGHAAHPDEVTGGWLDWGVRDSFREYVTGPIAQGSWEPIDGATVVDGNEIRFHSAAGEFEPDSGDFHASYSGGVRFVGHQREDGSYELDLTFANPTVEIVNGSATLYLDVTGGAGSSDQVPLATLRMSAVDVDGADTATASEVPATLTAAGAEAFAGFYAEGEQLDPVAFRGEIRTAPDDATDERDEPEPDAETPSPATPEPTGERSGSPPPATEPSTAELSPAAAESSRAPVPVVLGAVAVVVAAAIAGAVVLRRRGAGPPDEHDLNHEHE